jgi:hypothetical protein
MTVSHVSNAEIVSSKQLTEVELYKLMQDQGKTKVIYRNKKGGKSKKKTAQAKPTKTRARDLNTSKQIKPTNKQNTMRSLPAVVLPVIFVQNVYSYNNVVPVIVELVEDFNFGSTTIPKGSWVVGKSKLVRIGNNRLDMSFSKIIVKENDRIKKTYLVNAKTLMSDGTMGIIAKKSKEEKQEGFIETVSLGIVPFVTDVLTGSIKGNGTIDNIIRNESGAVLRTNYNNGLKVEKGTLAKIIFLDSVEERGRQ